MKNKKAKIGIWGFGVVGKAAARYFCDQGFLVEVFDSKKTFKAEQKKTNISFVQNLETFLEKNDFILPSPGIDLRLYKHHQHKWIAEVDIIQKHFTKPIVAITGTNGKTTVTHLLSELLTKNGIRVWAGGNIGTGMLDLLSEKKEIDVAVLELSSFQLEHSKTFAPTVAIWTNFSENHLNRHGTKENYFAAKRKLFECQTKEQHAIVPLSIKPDFEKFKAIKNLPCFFSTVVSKKDDADYILTEQETVMRHKSGERISCPSMTTIFRLLPEQTFLENRLIVALAAEKITKLLDKTISKSVKMCSLPHRLENVATSKGVTFFNDSKSTTPAATQAALKNFSKKPVLLFLGGLSKGIDRASFIRSLPNNVKKIYFFGTEAKSLAMHAKQNYQTFADLDTAFAQCVHDAQLGDQILFSPAGSSFDLFSNYKARGDYFRQLVQQLKKTQKN